MNLDQIETKCFILSLFIRDDDERFLLGSRAYEFKDSQLHFVGNMYQNDVVEVQGNDGIMLAGQVRRSNTQTFDGYIGDSSVDRSTIEQYRRDFMQFFRKNHYYKVVYIFTDGTAIQRRNGFIVEAPEVKELYQLFPEYHIGMNFEDINYYTYEEDSEGQEIYGESATLKIATAATGGLIWEEGTQTTVSGEGSNFTLDDTIAGGEISDLQLKGDTTQQTYSGKNLLPITMTSQTINGITFTVNADKSITMSGTATARTEPKIYQSGTGVPSITLQAGTTYHNSMANTLLYLYTGNYRIISNNGNYTPSANETVQYAYIRVENGESVNTTIYPMLEQGSTASSYEPYVGGIPAPNPDYPQEVQVVTGEQTVTITDGAEESQEYEVNLGKNLFDATTPNILWGYISAAGVITQGGVDTDAMFYIPCSPNTTYTVQKGLQTTTSKNRFRIGTTSTVPDYNATVSDYWKMDDGGTDTSHTITTSNNARYLVVYCYGNDTETTRQALFNTVQVELGSTATTYAPYFTPIELCKIGAYQDYIYKSGGDWYVHKEVVKISPDGTESWNSLSISNPNYIYCYTSAFDSQVKPKVWDGLLSDKFIVYDHSDGTYNWLSPSATIKYPCFSNGDNSETINLRIMCPKTTASSLANFKTWLGTNRPVFYYPINAATDTQITNTALISQLEALAGATTYDGQTVFTVTSENQLAILDVTVIARTGGGVVWDNYGAEWEEGTGGGPTMIDIESIDNVYPVWELTGPAVNPQISVLTTNTTLSYTGSITASQTLSVDMFNKTATLNGVSVVGNISGDWVYLEPGINRLTYTTSNADAPDSTIWWQEIVG